MKKRVLMLVASDPDSDPRIDWEASYAPPEFAVTAMGACGPAARGPGKEPRANYTVLRVPRDGKGVVNFLRRAARLLVPAWVRPLLVLVLLPPLLAAAVLQCFCRGLKRRIGDGPIYVALRRAAKFVLSLFGLQIPLGFFRHVVISSAALWRGMLAEGLDEQAIVHCNDLETLLAGVMARRAFGCKLVYDCHEFLPHAWPEATRWNRWLLSCYEGWLIGEADCVFTVSPLLAAEMMRTYRGVKVQSLPNAEPLRDLGDLAAAAKRDCEAAGRKPLAFLLQGSFGPGRGIEELIRAWRAIDPGEAVLLLRGNPHAHKTKCVRLAESLGLKDVGVFFPPPVRAAGRIAAAIEADVGVIPYKPITVHFRYCCPNKLSEYMQAGLPLMAGNTEYVSQIVFESGAGLCYDPTDAESIVAAVRSLVQDPALRRRCGKNAARYVRETFHWQARSKPLYDAYRRLAGLPESGDVAPEGRLTIAQRFIAGIEV